ncbi:MAG: prolyl oligopeptidase family serine peptidase [Acidobacteriia bacterium]|nr:prolyl oligopeptidase family serine peptidase [Terriglobia bacterium]
MPAGSMTRQATHRTAVAFAPIPPQRAGGKETGAASAPATDKETQWNAEDMIAEEKGEEFRISPDAKWVVWVKEYPDADKDEMVANLFLTSLVEKQEIQLTRGPNKDANPRWSPEGKLLAFLSDRPLPKKPGKDEEDTPKEPPKTQLWLINPQGGEPWPLTRLERDVKDFDWIDAENILMAAEEDLSLYERELKEKKDDSRAIDDALHSPPVRLFRVNVKSGEITRFTANDDWIQSVNVSPDGKWAAAVHQRSLSYEFDEKVKPVTYLYGLASGDSKKIFTEGTIIASQLLWTPDSRGVYAVAPYSTDPVYHQAFVNRLYYYDAALGRAANVDLQWENDLTVDSPVAYAVTPEGFIALLAAGARYKPARYTRHGERWDREWLEGQDVNNLFSLAASRDGRTLVYLSSTASRPEQWFRATLEGVKLTGRAQLTELNPKIEKKISARSEVVRWKGSLDEDVEGILFYPRDYQAGTKYPLVLMIHGGPLGADMDSWDQDYAYPVNLYTERGAFVLRPNYHGSSNYGLKFAESIGGGKYYDLEVPDIEKGVDALIARGLVDPKRLATLGWSNGAILTIALTVETPRYKVASAGAGDVEQPSDWAYTDFGAAFDNYYFGAAPIDDPQLYIRKSPMYEFKKVRTPTIIFSGTDDRSVGHAQAWEHFRTLQQLGQTDVRFIAFPGEPHGLKKISHRRRKVEEELAWFNKYFLKPGPPANEALKDDSPLAQAPKRRNIQRAGARDGVLVKSTLIPEVVTYQGLRLGRFEVTRAQYAAFDGDYKIEPGTENYPASGISFEKAQAYCAWLSKLSGESYRLGKVDELEPIYKAAKENENTLDYWAGYNVNPDDAAHLAAKVRELAGAAPLLKEVGSFKGHGDDDLVFDLGGNVAEWAIDKDGSGKPFGGSADRPADQKARQSAPDPAYVGFRVVKGVR